MTKNSPSSVDGSLHKTNNATAGCLSQIIRCLLCAKLSSPSSNNREETKEADSPAQCQDGKNQEKTMTAPSPGIVARLMGLESMPDELGWISPIPNSIRRRRLEKSLNNWPKFDSMQRQHRPVRTSMSFRKIPTFLRQENEEFLILSFGSDEREESGIFGTKKLKSDMGFRELTRKRADNSKSMMKENGEQARLEKKDQGRSSCKKNVLGRRIDERHSRKPSNSSEIKGKIAPNKKEIFRKSRSVSKAEKLYRQINYKGMSDGAKFSKNTKEDSSDKKLESEFSSEKSSPVSVLDRPFDTDSDFLIDSETLIFEEDSKPSPLSRKLSTGIANFDYPCSLVGCISISDERELETIDEEGKEPRKMDCQPPDYSELWGVLCWLSEEDVKKSNCVEAWKVEDVEEVGIEFGLQILERLLHEAVAEFAEQISAV
ncbi:uncharacterized protein LOC143848778 [Tasmannia lanceolata]|uniref:uncharacterized protein LOC143848778 n=1 Tax=Tasmannia lanceolata TaxID=3420 RepID=UPI004064A02E